MELNIAQKNFTDWNEALRNKDLEKIVLLYADEATFLPTMSDDFKVGQKDVQEYFEHFLKKNPTGEIIAEKIQPLSQNTYLHSGFYNFEVDDGLESRQTLKARFSFIWKKNTKWEILHHHSSVKPE